MFKKKLGSGLLLQADEYTAAEMEEEDVSLIGASSGNSSSHLEGAGGPLRYVQLPNGFFSCCLCFKQFWGLFNMNRHLMVHSGEKPFTCFSCAYSCAQKATLQRHCLRTHKMTKEHFAAVFAAREDESDTATPGAAPPLEEFL